MGKISRKKIQQTGKNSNPQAAVPFIQTQSLFLRPLPALLFILFLSLLVHLNVLANGFGWDDEDIINALIFPEHWWNLFFYNPVSATTDEVIPYYRPLVMVSYLMDFMIWGRNPFGFHLSVLLGHILNSGLVLLLSKRLTAWMDMKPTTAHNSHYLIYNSLPLLTASLFAVHPVHAEAIAWIAGRNDVFCTTFVLSSMILYIRFSRTGKEWAFGLSMLFFFFALITKEMAVGLVIMYPLYDYFSKSESLSRPKRQIGIRFFIPLAILGLYFFLRTLYLSHPFINLFSEKASSPFFIVVGAVGLYLKLILFPYPHSPFIMALPGSSIALFLTGLGLLLLIGAAIWALLRRHLLIGWGFVWMLVFLIPAIPIALLNVAAAPAAERYLYAPSIGFLMSIVGLMLHSVDWFTVKMRWIDRKVWTSMVFLWVVLLIVFGWGTWNRNAVWRSPLTFWKTVVSGLSENVSPEAFIAHYNLGGALRDIGKIDEAIFHFSESLRLKPDYVDTSNNLANLLLLKGKVDDAVALYSNALKYKPDDADVHYNLAIALEKQEKPDKALEHYQMALKVNPASPIYHNSLGNFLVSRKNYDEAVVHYSEAIKNKPDYAEAHYNMGNAFVGHEKYEEAIPHYLEAINLKPNYTEALNNLGGAYARLERWEDAVKMWNDVLSIDPNNETARQNHDAVMRKLRRIQ